MSEAGDESGESDCSAVNSIEPKQKPNRLHVWFSVGSTRTFSLSAAIRSLTDFPYAHVSVGYDGVVLDPSMSGNALWPITSYLSHYPASWRFSFRVPGSPCFERFALGDTKPSPWHKLAYWLAPRVFPHADDSGCVHTVRLAMTNAGVRVPMLTTPGDLYRWLDARGFPNGPTQRARRLDAQAAA